MSRQIIATVVLSSLSLIATSYLDEESNYLKPKLERNNVVNKGLWIRNNKPRNPTDFIFRANSLDGDKLLQNNYDSFGMNIESSPFFNSYIDRKKRSAKDIQEQSTDSLKRCKNNVCLKTNVNKSSMIKSKLISTLKPASVFNDYPYEVAILLNNRKYPENNWIEETVSTQSHNLKGYNEIEQTKQKYNKTNENVTTAPKKDLFDNKKLSSTTQFDTNYQNQNITIPKRSMDRHDYETELIKKIEFTEQLNNTNIKLDRNVFDKEDMEWRHPGPVPNINVYKVLPKSKDFKHKSMTERGLIKVLSMLTKTFKKIMKQHHDIKRIHKTITNLNDDFLKNIEDLTTKYDDFNLKYLQIIKMNEEINLTEAKIRRKEMNFDQREKELSKNIIEFENQQKKFLNQQKQFYTVQKLMLAQNEKINIKQNLIAKTQSEISHRQNNFARILKKAKQIYIDSKNWSSTKLNTAIVKPKFKPVIETHQPIKVFTTTSPLPTTEPVKINLFSIAPLNKLRNQDQKILEEIDEQSVDELIYKYYFNNTFIDELMKNKILATFDAATEENNINKNKNKRNEEMKVQTTILLPINKTDSATTNIRKRRWIKHNNKNQQKLTTPPTAIRNNVKVKVTNVATQTNTKGDLNIMKNDPYVTMAENFCKQIGQTLNAQILKWCIEKALRRLQIIDLKLPLSIQTPNIQKSEIVPKNLSSERPVSTKPTFLTTVQKDDKQTKHLKTTDPRNTVMFFPDNEELENKIKDYELIPDPEGTVYFDGSLHSSDLGYIKKNSDVDSEGFSDIMLGLDSNSRVEVDPVTFDLQSQRRANVRRINERILKMRMG